MLIYPDVRAAVAWLTAAFGFAERVQIAENHRSQLSYGEARSSSATCATTADRLAEARSHTR